MSRIRIERVIVNGMEMYRVDNQLFLCKEDAMFRAGVNRYNEEFRRKNRKYRGYEGARRDNYNGCVYENWSDYNPFEEVRNGKILRGTKLG